MAIYALILNQVNKNEKNLKPTNLKDVQITPLNIGSSDRYDIDKYKYFDQQVFVVTSKDNSRKMLVFEDGTSYEVIDTKDAKPTRKGNTHFATASFSWR